MTENPRLDTSVDIPIHDGLLGYWPGIRSPAGHLRDYSQEGNHGIVGRPAKWVWYTNPRAMRFVGGRDQTFIGYLGGQSGTDIVVGAYDHDTKAYTTTQIADSVSTDDHANPAVYVKNDGEVVVFWSKHDGPRINYRISEAAEDITTFGDRRTLSQSSVCYPNPVQIGDREGAPLHLFYRERAGTGDGHVYYRISDDGGRTWGEGTRLVSAPDGHYSMYLVFATDDSGLHCFFTDAEGGSTTPKWNVMYGYFEDETVSTADGTLIGTRSDFPLVKSDLELVYDSSAAGNHFSWIWDAGLTPSDDPVVVYSTFPSSLKHEYRYSRWTGDGWTDTYLIDGGSYATADPIGRYFSAGIALDSRNANVVYAATNTEAGCTIKRLETDNEGRTFSAEPISENFGHNIRPVVPLNASPELPVVWLSGAYNNLDGCQTVLRGVPTAPERGTNRGVIGETAVSLGIDLYESEAFSDGLSLVSLLECGTYDHDQTVIDFEGACKLITGEGSPGSIEFCLQGANDNAAATWSEAHPQERYLVEGKWDGSETLELWINGDLMESTFFEGPIDFSGVRAGWTFLMGHHFVGNIFQGAISQVFLYNRYLAESESEKLAK